MRANENAVTLLLFILRDDTSLDDGVNRPINKN